MIKKLIAKRKLNKAFLLPLILLLALILRLYHFNNPIADWHAFRQADTASVTREYLKAGSVDYLRPHYHDLSNIQSGFDNLDGYRMVEMPFINGAIASLILGVEKMGWHWDLVVISRLGSILFSLLSIWALFNLSKEISDEKLAYLSALIYACLPFAIYYGRVILPEPYFLFLSNFSLWQFVLFLKKKNKRLGNYLLSIITLALAALLKPFVIFLGPLYLALIWHFLGKKFWQEAWLYIYPVIAFLPLLAWRQWILNFPTGIPVSDWLMNGNGIRLRPAWFRWLFYERLTKLFLGFAGLILLLSNCCQKRKDFAIYFSWWLSILIYLIVIATGNVQHDYYQNLLIPIVVISMARGSLILFEKFKNKIWGIVVVSLILLSSFYFSWQEIKGFFNVNHWEYIEAGKVVDQLVPKDAKVIAPAMGDTIFLFQTNRSGWPIGFAIDEKIQNGATVYVTTTYDNEARELEARYQTIEKTDQYLILDLTSKLETKE